MRSRTLPSLPGRCHLCYLKVELCLCARIPRVATRFGLVLLRHSREAPKSTNTARIAALALPQAQLWSYDGPTPELDATLRALPAPWLLFPDGEPLQPGAPGTLVVLDGTWRQTRRMFSRVEALQTLRRVSLPPPRIDRERLRRAPSPEGVSTLEAIAAAVALLEGEAAGEALFALHQEMVRRVLQGRGQRAREPLAL